MAEEKFDSVFSVCRQKKFRWSEPQHQQAPPEIVTPRNSEELVADVAASTHVNNNNSVNKPTCLKPPSTPTTAVSPAKAKTRTKPLNFDPRARPRRQDWRGDLVENGMFYFATRSLVLNDTLLQGGKKVAYIETPTSLSLEIDTSLDLALAEQIVLHGALQPYANSCDEVAE